MKKAYAAPQLRQECLKLDAAILADAVEGGSFQDGWLDVDSRFTDEF